MRFFVLLCFLVACSADVLALGNRPPSIRISAHIEGDEVETERFVVEMDTPRGKRWFRRVPEFTQNQIQDFRVFETETGSAVALLLDEEGKRRLRDLSIVKQGSGEYLVLTVNGRAQEFLRINAAIEDGIVIFWSGFSAEELEDLARQVRRNN